MSHTWAQQLKDGRARAGWSLRRLGQELGVSFSTLARIERGEGQPDAHTRWAVERWLFPQQGAVPCRCLQCSPTPGEGRLDRLERRVALLETQLAALLAETVEETAASLDEPL